MEVIFINEGIDTTIQCNINDKMENIINQYLIKIGKAEEKDNLFYLYNGNEIKKELIFKEQANELDKERCKMNIIVNRIDEPLYKNNEKLSKDIICPECKENILLDFNKFKINLHDCKNKHNLNDVMKLLYY